MMPRLNGISYSKLSDLEDWKHFKENASRVEKYQQELNDYQSKIDQIRELMSDLQDDINSVIVHVGTLFSGKKPSDENKHEFVVVDSIFYYLNFADLNEAFILLDKDHVGYCQVFLDSKERLYVLEDWKSSDGNPSNLVALEERVRMYRINKGLNVD